jgi:hypothetical protein
MRAGGYRLSHSEFFGKSNRADRRLNFSMSTSTRCILNNEKKALGTFYRCEAAQESWYAYC